MLHQDGQTGVIGRVCEWWMTVWVMTEVMRSVLPLNIWGFTVWVCIYLSSEYVLLYASLCWRGSFHAYTRLSAILTHAHTYKHAYTRTSGWLFSGFKMEFFNLTFYPRWESTPYSSYIPLGNRNHRLCLYNCVWVWAQWCLKLSAAKCAW